MIRINLLPHREAKRKARRQQFFVFAGLSLAAAIAIILAGYTVMETRISFQESRNKFLKDENARLDKQIAEIDQLQSEIDAVLSRKKIIESLQNDRVEAVNIFNELAKQVPDGIYLKSYKQTEAKIEIKGVTQSNSRVSTLMRNLGASPTFKDPQLVEIKTEKIDPKAQKTNKPRLRLSEFSMNATVKRTIQEDVDQAKKPKKTDAAPAKKDGKP